MLEEVLHDGPKSQVSKLSSLTSRYTAGTGGIMLLYIVALALPVFFLMRRILFSARAAPGPVVNIASGRVYRVQ